MKSRAAVGRSAANAGGANRSRSKAHQQNFIEASLRTGRGGHDWDDEEGRDRRRGHEIDMRGLARLEYNNSMMSYSMNKTSAPTVTFWGAAQSVTGSMHLVEAGETRVL